MHLNSHHRVITNFVAACVWMLITCGSAIAEEHFEFTVQQPVNRLLESLIADEDPEITAVLKQWADYLKAVSTYSQEDYRESFDILQKEYSYLIGKLELCMGNQKSSQNRYDPKWVDRLISHFGKSYLKDKEKSIIINIRMAVAGDTENCCGPILEKLFLKEAILYGAYSYYLNAFLDFCKELPPALSKLLKQRKNEAEDILDLIERVSILKVSIGRGLPRKILSEIASRNYDKTIYEWFKNNPIGCDIDAFKALEDFRKAIGSNQ